MVGEEILAQQGTPKGDANWNPLLQALGCKNGGHL